LDEYFKRGPRQKGGFRDWLRQHGFNKADAYDFMLLARNAETARNSGHSSIHATQMLRAKVGNSGKSKKSGASGSPLSKAAWTKATVQERQEFLDTIGADSICTALSFTLRAELKRRVADQQRATTSALGETVAKVFARRCRYRRLRGQGTCRPRVSRHRLSLQTTTTLSGCEHAFYGGAFWNRCRPGLSHHGRRGLASRDAAKWQVAR
jgi:hypothetical protein